MSNYIITNKQGSNMTLAPLLDTAGNALVLAPKGTQGDEREIDAETAAHEIIERVRLAGWVTVRPIAVTAPQNEPAAPPPTPEPPPAPAPEPAPEPEPEPVVTAPEAPPVTDDAKPAEPAEPVIPTETSSSSETPMPPKRRRP
jgi:hypothetical protein